MKRGGKVRGRNAQFFILAAVILSAIIISLGMTTNYIRVNREPQNFYDFSYEVKKESGVVLDHQIYYDFDDDANLTQFVDLLAADIRDKDPDSNFIFIYGNNQVMNLKNYGSKDISSGTTDVVGGARPIISSISFSIGDSHINTETAATYDNFDDDYEASVDLDGGGEIGVNVGGQEYIFPVSEHKQVIFIVQKDVNDESFVSVE